MRKFKCIGLEEKLSGGWIIGFTLGEVYTEHSICEYNSENWLNLIGDNPPWHYIVDKSQFEEAKGGIR